MNEEMLEGKEPENSSEQKDERDIRITQLQAELDETKDQLLRRTANPPLLQLPSLGTSRGLSPPELST